MIARTEIDKCFSTALNGHGAFNFDNEERTELSPELARSALDFTIGVKKCYDDMGREIPSLRHLQDNEGHFIPCHGVTDSFHPIQHVDVFDYIVNDVMPKMGNNMASRILGFDSAARVSLNRPCGNGMPSAGAIGMQGVLGLRT